MTGIVKKLGVDMIKDPTSQAGTNETLVGSETLLETIFPDERDRPTLRWLASMRQRRLLPFHKIGGLIRYDVGEVRAALDRNFRVEAK